MSSEVKKHEPQLIALDQPTAIKPVAVTTSREDDRAALKAQLSRRRVPRRAVQSAVGVLHKGQYQVAKCFEIGEGGMLISSSSKMQEGDSVVLTIRIPGVITGVMIGKVVYAMASEKQEHACYGLMFEEIGFEVRRKIRNYVASATSYVLGGRTK